MEEMKKENKKIDKIYFVYMAVIILQLLNMIYWANMKTNYYIDELYSMGYASSYTGAGDTAQYITTSEDWKFNEWIDNVDLKKYILVSEKESILQISFPQIVSKIVTGRNYFGILNLAESIAGNQNVTKWPGIIINLIFFLIADIVLIALFTRLKMSKWSICLFLAMFGFCGYIVGLAEYVRFYMFVVMMTLIMILLHHVIWTTDKSWKVIACEISSFALAYLSLKDSELTVVFAGALTGCYWIALLITKKWKKLGLYSAIILIGIIYLATRTNWLNILFRINTYAGTDGRVGELMMNIMGTSVSQIVVGIIWTVDLLPAFLFGHRPIFMAWGILFFFLITKISKDLKESDRITIDVSKIIVWILWAIITAASIINRRWIENDGVWIIMSLFIFAVLSFYLICSLLKKFFRINQLSSEDVFVMILAGTCVIYTIFIIIAGLYYSTRYCCFGFLTFIIVFGYMINRMVNRIQPQERVLYYAIITALIVIGCLAPLITRRVEYIYEQDQQMISSLQSYQGMDTVLVSTTDEHGTVTNETEYDCVNLLDDETRIYLIDLSQYEYNGEIFPEEFLLWTHIERDTADMIEELKMDGYKVQYLGEDHISRVYICRK